MKEHLSVEKMYLLRLIKKSLSENQEADILSGQELYEQELTRQQWETMLYLAKNHAVLPLLYEILEQNETMPKHFYEMTQTICRQTVKQNYKLLYLTNRIVKLLEREAISVLVLKGVATAVLYPVPELRKSGDVDLLIANSEEFNTACKILAEHDFVMKEKQMSNHHIEFISKEGIVVEIHSMLAEPFDNQKINNYLSNLSIEYHGHIQEEDVLGSRLPIAEDAYHAFYLLIHMLQHFLRSGFGLKYLCDWVVFWKRDIAEKEKERYLQLVRESGLFGFSEIITASCVRYLGLDESRVHFLMKEQWNKNVLEEFIEEIIEAEEFGKSGNDRMVMMRGTSLIDYLREFHHQMCLNYPKIKKIFVIWPVLWCITLVRFLRNNRKIRKISTRTILKKAKERSNRRKDMKLFKVEV